MTKRKRKYYRIGEAAERYAIHPQTLRLYEREGLIRPSRSRGNARYYTDEDLKRLEVVLSLTRELGVNLAGIEVILNMRARMTCLQEEIVRLQDALGVALMRLDENGSAGALVRALPTSVVRARRAGSQ